MGDCSFPEYADVRKVFLQEQEISGSLSLANLDNLSGILNSGNGRLCVNLRFFHNNSGQRIITGKLRADIEVLCQRCLQPLELAIEDDISLAVIENESDAKYLEANYDPWLCKEPRLSLVDLVGEQLILALPIVSLHSDPNCLEKLEYDLSETENGSDLVDAQTPFEGLRSLIEESTKK